MARSSHVHTLITIPYKSTPDNVALPSGLSREEVMSARCHYGTLPGRWIRSEGRALLPWHEDNSLNMTFPVWQPYCSKCQMKPLLSPYLMVSSIPPQQAACAALGLLRPACKHGLDLAVAQNGAG